MIDTDAMKVALRALLKTLQVCTTGATALSATATGYNRAAGSFVTDGFVAGMELQASGFVNGANNGYAVITGVTATDLEIDGGRTVEAAVAGRTLVVGLPSTRVWEGITMKPVAGHPYIEEEFVTDTPAKLIGIAKGGVVEELPMYIVRWYGLAGYGAADVVKCRDAVIKLFKISTTVTSASGDVVRVRGDQGPSRTSPRPDEPGWVVSTVTIPLRAYTFNT